jgi:hypothetical protein
MEIRCWVPQRLIDPVNCYKGANVASQKSGLLTFLLAVGNGVKLVRNRAGFFFIMSVSIIVLITSVRGVNKLPGYSGDKFNIDL